MSVSGNKQPVLKPQDLLVALKLLVNDEKHFTFAELGNELSMSASEVHAATERAVKSRLIMREFGRLSANKSSLYEFIVHGVKYVYPVLLSSVTRGLPTGISAAPLSKHFPQGNELIFVWPDPEAEARGWSLQPLYKSVPKAAKNDVRLYEMLVLVDAIRGGAAREREIAINELGRYL